MSEKYDWPGDFITRMKRWLGAEEAAAFFAALSKRDYGLRLNPSRGPLAELRARLPWETRPVPWCPAGVVVTEEEAELGTHPYHTTGVYYLQDPSAMAAAVLLDPQPDEWVLDLAAAPGSKTTHIAARMENRGVLVANDISRRRASVLAMNIERLGVTNTMVANETPERLAERWAGLFDAVLVDAPCSGEGTFARDARSMAEWSTATVASYAYRQGEILAQAARLVRPGGRLLYGTCTFSPEENEGVIAAFLSAHSEFTLASLPQLPGLSPGHPEWLEKAAGEIPERVWETLPRTGRFWPHTGPGHGHFYALVQRAGAPPDNLPERWRGTEVPGRVLEKYRQALADTLTTPPPEEGLFLAASDDLYAIPLAPPLWEGLRVLRPGWWLAMLRHDKIQFDHALAMTLRPTDAHRTADLAVDDPRLARYLRGGFWPDKGEDGYVLITVEGFPLGWGKRGGGRLRSRYPMHLRG